MQKTNSDEWFYYFGYGSNLLEERIRIMNASATFFTTGVLEGYSLGFVGYSQSWKGASATIYPNPSGIVEGVIWQLSQSDAASLSKQEHAYDEITVHVKSTREPKQMIVCKSYMKPVTLRDQIASKQEENKPSPHYKHVILCGAKQHRLSDEYITKLDNIETNGYVGDVRPSVYCSVLKNFRPK